MLNGMQGGDPVVALLAGRRGCGRMRASSRCGTELACVEGRGCSAGALLCSRICTQRSRRARRQFSTQHARALERTGHADLIRSDVGLRALDGGIDASTVEEVAINGANVFVMGSAFFRSKDYKRFVDEIRSILSPYDEENTGP